MKIMVLSITDFFGVKFKWDKIYKLLSSTSYTYEVLNMEPLTILQDIPTELIRLHTCIFLSFFFFLMKQHSSVSLNFKFWDNLTFSEKLQVQRPFLPWKHLQGSCWSDSSITLEYRSACWLRGIPLQFQCKQQN